MRLAPIPMAFASQPLEMLQHAADSSRTTHGARSCLDACRVLSVALARALDEAGVDLIVATGFEAGGHRPSFLARAEDGSLAALGSVGLVSSAGGAFFLRRERAKTDVRQEQTLDDVHHFATLVDREQRIRQRKRDYLVRANLRIARPVPIVNR